MAIPTTAATIMPLGTETNFMEATGQDGPLRLTAGSENQGKIIIAADVKDLCSCSDTFLQSLFLFNLCSLFRYVPPTTAKSLSLRELALHQIGSHLSLYK